MYLVPGGCTWSWGCTWSQEGVPGPGGHLVRYSPLWTGVLGVCVPGLGGVPGPRGCTWSWGVHLLPGECTWSRGAPGQVLPPVDRGPGGVCTWSGGCTCSQGSIPGPGGTWSGTPPLSPPRGQADACKNITFATSLRMVKTAY